MTEEEFKAALPEDLRANPSITKFKDLGSLAKSYVEAQGFLGSSIRPPGADATPEAKAEFRKKLMEKVPELVYAPEGDEETEKALYARLGKPEKLDEYKLPPEAEAAGLNADDLRALAANAGMTKKQFAAFAKQYAEGALATKSAATEAVKALKAEWGLAYEERLGDAKAAAVKMGVEAKDLEALTPAQLRVFANVAKAVSGGGAPFKKDEAPKNGRLTPEEAQQEIAEIMQRAEYFKPQPNTRATHDRLKARVAELMGMAYPE
jgi:hypothetical protein